MTRTFLRAAAALALLAGAAPAAAYVRETTTPGHPTTGVCLWWRPRQVTMHVNATSATTGPCGSAAAAEAATMEGLDTWGAATRTGEGSACTDFGFVHGAASGRTNVGNDGTNLIVFRGARCSDVVGTDSCASTPGACAAKFNCWEYGSTTIGLTTTSFDPDTGELLDADIELNGWDGQVPPLGFYFTCESAAAPRCNNPPHGQTGCSWTDVQAVVTHEAGHVMGLDHTCQYPAPNDACPAGSIMSPTVGEVDQRGLAQDDVDGICTLYPKGAGTLTCVNGGNVPQKDLPSGCGCGSAGGADVLGLIGLLAWVGRRNRGRTAWQAAPARPSTARRPVRLERGGAARSRGGASLS